MKNLATTGPYYIASRTLGQQLELKAVPNHWSGKQPAFEDVILRITGNADLVSLIKGGVVDYAAEGLTGRQYDALAAAGFPSCTANAVDPAGVDGDGQGAFTDARVRQAMLYAIPIDRIMKTALAGRGKRADLPLQSRGPNCINSFAKYSSTSPRRRRCWRKPASRTSRSTSGTVRRCPTITTSPF